MAKPKAPVAPEVAVSGEIPAPASAKWTDKVKAFAETCELEAADVEAKFVGLVGKASDKAADRLGNEKLSPYEDLSALFPDVPKAVLREAVNGLRDIQVTAAPVATHEGASDGAEEAPFVSLLPTVPDDTNLLASLGTFQGAQIDPIDVIAAMRVKLMQQLSLSDIESRIADAIEERAVNAGEQCPPIWDEIEMQRKRFAHAEVLKALGKPGDLISAARKKELLARVSDIFERVHDYKLVLDAYREEYDRRTNNPAHMMTAITQALGRASSGRGRRLSEAPSPNNVVAATEALIQSFNAMFAGNGRAVARGMAADAIATKAILDRTDLPAALGAASRVQMIKDLKLGVESDLINAEKDIQQFILGAMQLLQVPTNQLPDYIVDLSELGCVIPWPRLGVRGTVPGNGAARPLPGAGNRSFG